MSASAAGAPEQKHLLLVGGGHAHVHVLKALVTAPMSNARVSLVTPYARQLYSGMIPGYIAGHYSMDDCAIELPALARAASVTLVQGSVKALNAEASAVTLEDGEVIAYDIISINSGPVLSIAAASTAIKGVANYPERVITVRPIEQFVQWWDEFASAARASSKVVIVGAGAAGVELAFAMRYRLGHAATITLLTGGTPPVPGHSLRVQERVARALKAQHIEVVMEACVAVDASCVTTQSGTRIECDACVLALGTQAPQWLRGSGLALDERGFISVNIAQRSVSHANVFAVGDVASRADTPHAKSGVFAVRAGAPLTENLRRACANQTPVPYPIEQRNLNLLSCGERYAIVSWGGFSAEGAWAWHWKNWVDKRFMARYR